MSVLIPARGGSKGVPKKNVKLFGGKPLVAWSIEQALSSTLIDEVYVSTDDPEIASISEKFGAKVPFLRPESLSGDFATTESAMVHFCEYMDGIGDPLENLMLLQCTSPIRRCDTISRAVKRFYDGEFDSLLSVAHSHRFFWKNKERPRASYDYKNRPRRQDIQPTEINYLETGSLYISKVNGLLENKNRLFGKIGLLETSEYEAYEIDTNIDFAICETILKEMEIENKTNN